MLWTRIVFGSLMIVALFILFYLDNQLESVRLAGTFWQDVFFGREALPAGVLILGLGVLLCLLASRELTRIFEAKQIHCSPTMIGLASTLGLVLIYLIPRDLEAQATAAVYATALVLLFMVALLRHALHQKPEGAVAAASATMFSMIYIGILPGFYLAIRQEYSPWVIVAILLTVKCCDIGAYFTGRFLGRHKLVPWLSPGKTWEGLIGGMLLAGLVAMGMAAWGNASGQFGHWVVADGERVFLAYLLPLWFAFAAGVVFGLIGQFGDLTASLFKRDAGIKDSGRSIPGFGGVLDVMDSIVIAAPFAYWFLILSGTLYG